MWFFDIAVSIPVNALALFAVDQVGRLGIVELVFSNICVQKRMRRFTLHSKLKVDVQWRLFALVHNIGKIHAFETLT